MDVTSRNASRIAAVAVATACLAAAGCGSEAGGSTKPTMAELQSQLAGSPAPLAALHRHMATVQPGGRQAFERALQSVRGHPAVVNVWASWCGPCRYEFPALASVSGKLGKQVAFLGVASRDTAAASQRFLTSNPVGYPSWSDESGDLGHSLGVGNGLPATVFFTADGKRSYIHQGPYSSADDLQRDVIRYAEGK